MSLITQRYIHYAPKKKMEKKKRKTRNKFNPNYFTKLKASALLPRININQSRN